MPKEHKIGRTYQCNGNSYKLVKGAECKDCCLNEKIECQMMPECDSHEGHYENVDARDNLVLNIQRVSNNEVRVAVCDCDKPKYVLNEVKQELMCNCGKRYLLAN